MTPDIAPSSLSASRLSVIARAAQVVRPKARITRSASDAENMREWRKKAKAKGVNKITPVAEAASPGHTCPLCFESFQTGAAYMNHFAERRFGPGELHVCMSRDQMRSAGNLVPDWDTGAWAVRR